MKSAFQDSPQHTAAASAAPRTQHTAEEWALAEILRLRGWLKVISECAAANTAEEKYARRVRYIARRGLAGDAL